MSRKTSRSLQDTLASSPKFEEIAQNISSLPDTAPPILNPRGTALARAARGELKDVPRIFVDPAKCRIWSGNPRDQNLLTYESCQDLIQSILAEGGQRTPAIVRPIDEPPHEYEVIAGTRRHFAISWLRQNGHPDMPYIADIIHMDDVEAFRVADSENRGRASLTDYEAARGYAHALKAYFGGIQKSMAEELGIHPSWLNKLLAMTRLPAEVFQAYEKPTDLAATPAYDIIRAIEDNDAQEAAIEAARQVAAHRRMGHRMTPSDITRHIIAATKPPTAPTTREQIQRFHNGRTLVSLGRLTRNRLEIQIHRGTGANRETIIEAVGHILKQIPID